MHNHSNFDYRQLLFLPEIVGSSPQIGFDKYKYHIANKKYTFTGYNINMPYLDKTK